MHDGTTNAMSVAVDAADVVFGAAERTQRFEIHDDELVEILRHEGPTRAGHQRDQARVDSVALREGGADPLERVATGESPARHTVIITPLPVNA